MFKGVARSVGRINQMSQMYRENLFRVHQRNLHLRNSAMKPNLMRDFHQMQRFQNLGRYRFSTFPGKKTLLPQNLMPMVSRRLMSTKEAMRFGKVFKDYMAKRDMKDARFLQQSGQREGWCTPEQLKEFKSRFYGGNENIDGALSYKHPTSKFTALYIMTSAAGDHNGAFASLEGGSTNGGLWNMCGRMLRMSSLYNVIYKRVNSVADATEFVKEVKNDPDFVKDGKALKHVTISGHGNPGTLVLGENRILSSELTASRDTITKKFLKELKPALVHTGEARSTVFLDSCSTGQQPKNGGDPLAQLVADALPGVEVHAFEDVSYPKLVKLQDSFVKDANFQCQWKLDGKCLQASVFMSKTDSTVDTSQESLPEPQYRRPVYDEPDAYLELSRANVSLGHQNKDDEFVFYDGVSFAADPQMCAEWCGMIQECHSFQFVEVLDDEVLDLGMCILKASPKKALESLDESHESEVDSEFDYETLD